jgi:hypothetical protein
MSWRILGRTVEGTPFVVAGVNVWESEWESLGADHVDVVDPTYRETHSLRRYKVQRADRLAVFAAGETSANVWMFAVEE